MKYLKYIVFTLIIIINLNNKVYAADSDDYALFQQGFYDIYNTYIGNENVSNVVNRWELEEKYLYSGINGNYYYFIITSDSTRINNDVLQVNNGDLMYVRSFSQISSNTDYGYFQSVSGNFTCTNGYLWGLFSEFMNPIDFNNIYYNPIIPVPNYSVKNYLHLNDYSIDYTLLVTDQSLSIDGNPLYLMSKIYFYVPADVYIDYNSFSPANYQKSDPYYIADYSDMELVSYSSFDLDNRFHSDYQEFYETIANTRNISSPSGMSAGTLLQRTTLFADLSAEGVPYMGNQLEVWMRYFYVDDGVIYAGDWKKWNSLRYREYEKIVAEEEGAPSKGIQQTINENDPVTDTDTYNPIGTQTGNVSQNVTVNTNVPNYPDYPTIAKYNHDNVLVQFIDTANYLQDNERGFFGQFGQFLSSMFGFIPASYWYIVGLGLLGTIVVMIIKIL